MLFRSATEPVPIHFLSTIPTKEELMELTDYGTIPTLILFDDFNLELFNLELSQELFCRMATHGNISTLATLHSSSGSKAPYLSLCIQNANCFIIFPAFSDRRSINYLGSKLFPGVSLFLPKCLQLVSGLFNHQHPYIYIDCSANNSLNSQYAVRSNILAYTVADPLGIGHIFIKNPYS